MSEINKKIAFIHDDFPGGGGERVTIDVANYLSSNNFKVYVFAGRYLKDRLPVDIPMGYEVIELPERYVETSMADARAMINTIKEKNIEVIISVGRNLLYTDEIKTATGCKYIFALHSVPFWEKEFEIERARKRRNHSFGSKMEWFLISYPKHFWFKKAYRKVRNRYISLYNEADRFTVLCDAFKNDLIKGLNLQPENNKVRVISNSERPAANLNLKKKKQILYIGRLSYVDKRVDRLLEVWKKIYQQLDEWELIIVGDGDERSNLEAQSQKYQLERIQFVGFSNDTSSFYRDASILCLVSTFEGWPLCLTEAQANGVVPVAFDCSAGVHQILAPTRVNGVLVPPYNIDAFADALLRLATDEKLLSEMQKNVIEKSSEYSIERIGKQWVDLLNEL